MRFKTIKETIRHFTKNSLIETKHFLDITNDNQYQFEMQTERILHTANNLALDHPLIANPIHKFTHFMELVADEINPLIADDNNINLVGHQDDFN